ncbi:hypothetical protein BH23CHL2_BH23CHL2_03100 [soil metagenome]
MVIENAPTLTPGKRRLRIFLMYILPPLFALFVVLLPLLSTVSVLPRIRVSSGFALIDQRGQTLTNRDLHGQIVMFGLVSLDCGAPCRNTLGAMNEATRRFDAASADPDQPEIHLVTIVVDPIEDPEALQAFATKFDIVADEWSVVSGASPRCEPLWDRDSRCTCGRQTLVDLTAIRLSF